MLSFQLNKIGEYRTRRISQSSEIEILTGEDVQIPILNEDPNMYGKLKTPLDLNKGKEAFRDESGDEKMETLMYIEKTVPEGACLKQAINSDFVSNRNLLRRIAMMSYQNLQIEFQAVKQKGIIFLKVEETKSPSSQKHHHVMPVAPTCLCCSEETYRSICFIGMMKSSSEDGPQEYTVGLKGCIFLLLSHPNNEQGILLANKSPFSEDEGSIRALLESAKLREISKNDIFGSYDIAIDSDCNLLKLQLIFPVNDRLIAKYRQEEKFVIRETAEYYEKITKPYIEKYQLNLNWVDNCLEKKSEVDKCVFEDDDEHNGFMLMQDIKWDGKTIENLYVLAIAHRHGLKSVRDLTVDDLPLLVNIRDKSLQAINDKYGLRKDQVKSYFHYQPSFYHLHVHFINLKYDAPASTTMSAILLDDVINNIMLNGDHYKLSTLTFTRKSSDKLLELYREAGAAEKA